MMKNVTDLKRQIYKKTTLTRRDMTSEKRNSYKVKLRNDREIENTTTWNNKLEYKNNLNMRNNIFIKKKQNYLKIEEHWQVEKGQTIRTTMN